MLYILGFFVFKCSLFHNANLFGSCITHILYTGCAKIKKKEFQRQRLRKSCQIVIEIMHRNRSLVCTFQYLRHIDWSIGRNVQDCLITLLPQLLVLLWLLDLGRVPYYVRSSLPSICRMKKSAALSRTPSHFLSCLPAVSSYNSLRPFDLTLTPTPPSYQQTSSTNLRQTEYQPFSSPHFQFVLNSSPGVCCRNTGYANRSRITADALIHERQDMD